MCWFFSAILSYFLLASYSRTMLGARGSFQDRYEKIKLLGEGAFGFSVASGLLIDVDVVDVDDDDVVDDDVVDDDVDDDDDYDDDDDVDDDDGDDEDDDDDDGDDDD